MTKIQVQAVLYKNEPEELKRAVRSIDRAAELLKEGSVSLVWGDASETPVFAEETWRSFRQEASHLEKAEYRFFGENTGYGLGNNLLAQDSGADYLLIMNPEILLSPWALQDLLSPFEDERVGLTEARQIPVEHPKAYNRETYETEWSSGACFMIPGQLFEKLGGFDAGTFFMYCEDVDLSWRIRMTGRRLYYQPLAVVFHARRFAESGRDLLRDTEKKYSVLSEALLAYKWSRPEYARERIRLAVEHGEPGSREAAEAFRKMEERGELPDFHDPEHLTAHIVQFPQDGGMLFAPHRYQL